MGSDTWRRRDAVVLGALAALGLAGCNTQRPDAPVAPIAPAGSPTTNSSSRAPSSPAPTPSRPPAQPSRPTRSEIVEQYGRLAPKAFGLEVPGVVSRLPSDTVVLTFDACGGPGGGDGVDTELIALLHRLDVPATLFLNVRWIDANQGLAHDLAQDPLFELANHGKRHRPLTVRERTAYGIRGTRNVGEVYDEVEAATSWFVEHTGVPARWFRSGTAHVDDVAAAVAHQMGQPIAGFSVNADAGATAPRRAITREVAGVRAGDIVIGHMNRPEHATAEGMAMALPQLLDRGTEFTHLTIS